MGKEELLAQGAANYKALLLPVRPRPFTRTPDRQALLLILSLPLASVSTPNLTVLQFWRCRCSCLQRENFGNTA